MTDEHQSYGSEDDKDVQEFADFKIYTPPFWDLHPIWKGLFWSALVGVVLGLIIFLVVYLILEGII